MLDQSIAAQTKDGRDIVAVYYENEATKESFSVMNYGAAILSMSVLPFDGEQKSIPRDVVLGFENISDYFNNPECFGVVIGPNANRIENASFEFEGRAYRLDKNDGNNNNHSGMCGWNKRLWKLVELEEYNKGNGGCKIMMSIDSPEGECGFPGGMEAMVEYTFSNGRLTIDYRAFAKTDTIFNPTNHSYFNLNGHAKGSVEGHYLKINAKSFLAAGKDSTPRGEIRVVEGTPFDFRKEKSIGEHIDEDYDELKFGKGYDHCFVLEDAVGLKHAATLMDEKKQIQMDVYTDAPGMMVYTGNYLSGEVGKSGCVYERRGGVALETQYFPNALNVADFDIPVVKKAEEVHYQTVYEFRRK